MITRLFALRLFEGFSITRWNDRIRPFELTEMDKNALKAVIVYFLGRYEEDHGKKIDWNYIIYGIFFGLLKNIVLSDIKSPVHRKIKNQYKEEFKKLNQWVVEQYKLIIDDNDFLDKFSKFLNEVSDENSIELRLLRASHKFSTLLEFKIIEPFNLSSPFMNIIRKDIYSEIEKYMDLYGLRDLIAEKKLYDLVRTIEQLRFQVRWSQTPRMPKTSVLGHSFYVACLMIVFSRRIKACDKRLFNNFFGGLFHDLPESVTRDIISPVKRATENLPSIINEIEDEVCEELLFPNIPDFLKREMCQPKHYFWAV